MISQCAHVCQRGVRWGDWLYMRTYHDGYHLFPDEMLFNVRADPHEQHDLAATRPDLCGEGARLLEAWHAADDAHDAAGRRRRSDADGAGGGRPVPRARPPGGLP